MSIIPALTLPYIKEKWRHAGFQRYFKNMGWSFAGRLFSLIISLFIGALVARYLGPTRYGALNYALSFVTIFAFLASFGVDNILVRDLVKFKEGKEKILNTAFTLKLIGGILVIFITIIASLFLKNDIYTTSLILIYSSTLLFSSFSVVDSYFQSIVKYKYPFITQFISTILVSILKIFLVYNGFGTGWFILALIFEASIYCFFMLRFFTKEGYQLRLSLDLTLAKKMLSDAWPFIFSFAFFLIYTKIDQIMIGKMIDITALGIYSAGVKLAEIWYFIPAIICGVLFPAIVNAKIAHDEIYKKRVKRILIFIIIISFIIALFEFIFAKYLILYLFGQAYSGSIIILKIYTWAGIIVSMITVMQQYLTIENKTKLIMVSSFVGAIANIALNLLLIPKYGIVGSAWATIISYSLIPTIIFLTLRFERKVN